MEQREWLIQIRGEKTQEEVANESGISRSAYSNVESGKRNPSVSMAKKIAGALNFDWKLFFEENCFVTKNAESA